MEPDFRALQVIAEVSLGLVGFSAIIIALSRSKDGFSDPDNFRVQLLNFAAFGAMFNALLPFAIFGEDKQGSKSKIASGEILACFALTEPNAGSDAMAGTTTATLNNEKTHYLLNGQIIYCTNGTWSDICITFAKVDGKHYTAFIIDKECEGWVVGAEEKKMGIKGSSTCTFFFENCKVPVENVLGEIGQGGTIALNVLYTGRYKLGVTTAAGAKYTINAAYDFAKEREQFSRSITKFDMIKAKFAKMITRTWEADNVNYMTCGSIDKSIEKLDKNSQDYYIEMQKVIEDHSIEASVCKIIGSEALAYVVDESVLILGGAGFIEEYGIATLYRDERINRIFEGTNEINRLLIAGMTLKKSILEELPIRDSISLRENDWLYSSSESNENEKVVEYCRSACLATFPVSNEIFFPFISISSLCILNIISLNLVVLLFSHKTSVFFFLNSLAIFFFY